jgi:hypothetical protein
VNLKAIGYFPMQSGQIDLVSTDSPETVAAKAANQLCSAVFATFANCSATLSGSGCVGAACCPLGTSGNTLTVTCPPAPASPTLVLNRAAFGFVLVANGPGNIANLNVENKNIYPQVRADLAARVLLQALPNGGNGTVQVRIFHTQGGANPKTASVANLQTGFADNQARQNAIRDAINALAFAPDVVAVTHAPGDAVLPLTYFPTTYHGDYFVEITNAAAAGVTDVEVIGLPGWSITLEPTENVLDQPALNPPALGSWGIVVVVAMLLVSGYWLMRRRRGAATA